MFKSRTARKSYNKRYNVYMNSDLSAKVNMLNKINGITLDNNKDSGTI